MPQVPLKQLGKRSSRFGATCWGITTHEASWAGGWVMAYAKSVKQAYFLDIRKKTQGVKNSKLKRKTQNSS